MKHRKMLLVTSFVCALAIVGASPAVASTGVVRTAPYFWSSEETLCSAGGGTCTVTADADATTGRIKTSALRGAEKLTSQYGWARALGVVSDGFKPTPKARSVKAIVTFRVDSETASLISDVNDGSAFSMARAVLEISTSWGWIYETSYVILTDTEASTAAPASLSKAEFTITVERVLNAGQNFSGGALLHLYVISRADLSNPSKISVIDRQATATAAVTVTSIEFIAS